MFLEGVTAIARCNERAIIQCKEDVCPKAEVEAILQRECQQSEDVLVTNSFLPLSRIAPHIDAFVCHGGQGTVQTALAGGCVIVGVPMQFEQYWNLHVIQSRGAGILIERERWFASTIGEAIGEVLTTPSFGAMAENLKDEMLKEGEEAAIKAGSSVLRVCGSQQT